MGAIRTSIAINDGMTSVMRRINKVMDTMINNFEAVQRASGQAINTQGFVNVRREMGAIDSQLNEIESNYRRINNQQNEFNRKISTGTSGADGLMNKIKGIAGAYLSMKTLGSIVGLSDTLTGNRARLEMIVDDGGSVAELEQKIFDSAQRARAGFTDTMETVSKLGLVAGKAFRSNDEIIAFQELVNKNFVIGGASATEQASAMYQLTQAMGSGRLQGDEYRSIIENAPLLAKSIEDYMRNVQGATGTMKDWASEGKLTANVIKAAVFKSADEVEERFNNMPKTWGQVWTSMKNRAIKAMGPVLAKINELANNQKVQNTIDGLVNGLALVANVAAGVFEVISNIYSFMVDNWSWIGPIIMSVVGALLAYKAALAIITAAQWVLNAAMCANPIGLIVALVAVLIVLVAIFFEQLMGAEYWLGALFKNVGLWIANVAIAIWNTIKNIGLWIANLGLAIWQVIKNIGAWLANLGSAIWTIIKNVGLWFANLGLGIWEVIKACANNIGVAFNNAWVSVQQGFWGMVDVIMQGLKKIANLANKVLGWMGVNIDTSGLDYAAKKINDLNSKKESYTSIGDAWDEGFNTFKYDSVSDAWNSHEYGSVDEAFNTYDVDFGKGWSEGMNTFDTFQDGWGSDAYNAGAEAGRNIKDTVTGIFDDMLGAFGGNNGEMGTNPFDSSSSLDDITKNTGDTAMNTSKSNEELSYLRDIAEREAINRFTTAEIKVDMSGMSNRIDSNMDIDGIISYLTDGVAEALVTASEGVY